MCCRLLGGSLAIPATGGPYATLPVGRHSATFDEVYEHFVEKAPFRERRELIYEALRLYAKVVADTDVAAVVPMTDDTNMCSNTDCLRFLTLQGVMVAIPTTMVPVPRIQPIGGVD